VQKEKLQKIRDSSRKLYNRTKLETMKKVEKEQWDVIQKLSDFSEPIL
jgi:hypothetical protein